jgi:hypothetical protein
MKKNTPYYFLFFMLASCGPHRMELWSEGIVTLPENKKQPVQAAQLKYRDLIRRLR